MSERMSKQKKVCTSNAKCCRHKPVSETIGNTWKKKSNTRDCILSNSVRAGNQDDESPKQSTKTTKRRNRKAYAESRDEGRRVESTLVDLRFQSFSSPVVTRHVSQARKKSVSLTFKRPPRLFVEIFLTNTSRYSTNSTRSTVFMMKTLENLNK